MPKLRQLLVICINCVLAIGAGYADEAPITRVVELRLEGRLTESIELAERQITLHSGDRIVKIYYHLELARAHDRIGLHNNSRPVAKSLSHIDAAAALAEPMDESALADIELARADYFYRAEMSERVFPRAVIHAERAIAQYRILVDHHGEAEATHRLGLIHLQRRELAEAMTMFDKSLELDQAGGERVFFGGEYGRHVGFVHLMRDESELAIPFLRRSLSDRVEAGAIDASLFAAVTLGSALIATGQSIEAKSHVLYAMAIANQIGSAAGMARAAPLLGQIHEADENYPAAREAYETALHVAEEIGYAETATRMNAALKRLDAALRGTSK